MREEAQERAAKSGVRALDWREPLRLPIVPDAAERRLYVHLFGEVDRSLRGASRQPAVRAADAATATRWCCRPIPGRA